MRHRERQSIHIIESTVNRYYADRVTVRNTPTQYSKYIGKVEKMDDYITSRFKTLQKRGYTFANPMTKETIVTTESVTPFENYMGKTSSGSASSTGFLDVGTQLGSHLCPELISYESMFSEGEIANAQAQAMNSALANVGQESGTNILVTVAELKKTALGILNVLRHGSSLLKVVDPKYRELPLQWRDQFGYRHKGKRYTNLEGGVASAYLEWRYSIRTTIYEVLGLIETYRVTTQGTNRFTARGYGAVNKDISDDVLDNSTFASYNVHAHRTCKGNVNVRAWVSYQYETQSDKAAGLLGITRILQAGWELVPFSFIVDWFISVGTWLAALDARIGITTLNSGVTTEITYVRSVETTALTVKYGVYAEDTSRGRYVKGNGFIAEQRTLKTRTLGVSASLHPTYNEKLLEVEKWLDLLAIFTQIMREKSK